MMQEPEPWTRPLQNHLLVLRHLTTHAGLWIPQYLHDGSQPSAPHCNRERGPDAGFENDFGPSTSERLEDKLVLGMRGIFIWVASTFHHARSEPSWVVLHLHSPANLSPSRCAISAGYGIA